MYVHTYMLIILLFSVILAVGLGRRSIWILRFSFLFFSWLGRRTGGETVLYYRIVVQIICIIILLPHLAGACGSEEGRKEVRKEGRKEGKGMSVRLAHHLIYTGSI